MKKLKQLSLNEIEIQKALGMHISDYTIRMLNRHIYRMRKPESFRTFYKRIEHIFSDEISRFTVRSYKSDKTNSVGIGKLLCNVVSNKYCPADLRDEIIIKMFMNCYSTWPMNNPWGAVWSVLSKYTFK